MNTKLRKARFLVGHAPSRPSSSGCARGLQRFHCPSAAWGFGLSLPTLAPFFAHPEHFDAVAMAPGFDFVLTRNEATDGKVFGRFAARVPPLGRDGAWRLYATRGLRFATKWGTGSTRIVQASGCRSS